MGGGVPPPLDPGRLGLRTVDVAVGVLRHLRQVRRPVAEDHGAGGDDSIEGLLPHAARRQLGRDVGGADAYAVWVVWNSVTSPGAAALVKPHVVVLTSVEDRFPALMSVCP